MFVATNLMSNFLVEQEGSDILQRETFIMACQGNVKVFAELILEKCEIAIEGKMCDCW